MSGEIRFTRLDSGHSVELSHRPQAVPRPVALSELLRNSLAPQPDSLLGAVGGGNGSRGGVVHLGSLTIHIKCMY